MIKKLIKIKGVNFCNCKTLVSLCENKLYLFFNEVIIFTIIVIVVFYKNKMIIATLDSSKNLILQLI